MHTITKFLHTEYWNTENYAPAFEDLNGTDQQSSLRTYDYDETIRSNLSQF